MTSLLKKSACGMLLALLATTGFSATGEDPVVFHFDTVGDSRQAPGDAGLTAQDAIWLQATKVTSRMMREIQTGHPQAFIFNGDMIYGYSEDCAALDKEYAFWRGMMTGFLETGTYVLPVPGNHEMQIKRKDENGKTRKVAVLSSELAWRANMGDLVLNEGLWRELTQQKAVAWSVDNAPVVGTDGVTTDQRQLSYSFDSGSVHLAVVNTDPVGFDSSVPVEWLKADFEAARKRGAKHFFVFGHKMAFGYVPDKRDPKAADSETGLDHRLAVRDAFWDLMESYGATYFCGHEHVFHAEQPRKNAGGKSWQVIVGSGGSPFGVKPEETTKASDREYAWADVAVHASGRVHVKIQGFDEAFGPTHTIQEWDMSQ